MATTEQIPATHSADAWEAAVAALDARAEAGRRLLEDLDGELARRWPDGTPDAEAWRALMRPRVERRARAWIALAAAVRAELDRRGPRGASARYGSPEWIAVCDPEGPHGDATMRSERGRYASLTVARDRYVRQLVGALSAWVARWGPRRAQRPVPLRWGERVAIEWALDRLGEPEGSGWGPHWGEPEQGEGCEAFVASLEAALLAGAATARARGRRRALPSPRDLDPGWRGWAYELAAWLLGDVLSPRAIKKIARSAPGEVEDARRAAEQMTTE